MDKYITSQEFNNLTTENLTARFVKSKLATETDVRDFVEKCIFVKKWKK